MFGFRRRGEGSEVQAIVDSAAVRLILPVKCWSFPWVRCALLIK